MAPFDKQYATFYWSAIVNIAISCAIFELYRDFEIGVRGHSISLKLVPFESLGAVSYPPSIVTAAVSVAVCEIFSVKNGVTLKTRLRVVKAIVTIAVSYTIFEFFDVE